ncbi:hypothetical protein SAMN04487912_102338 [Arthrobacter sp. cf158]|uniref:hypothetical protein n=1 Tax=Arthrobacter sp. cf158 TaxID=1761744 RepID=UPI00089A0F48|nr:hypothetical protein [Arthrobacter sp. cf158]SDW32689.1 hypothetical protein SAMN04487912_102338 [Arthrobacter sp. cf158]
MIDGIPAVVNLASPLAATIAVFYLVFTGRLWTKAAHMDVVRVLEDQIAALVTDRNNWQSAATLANQTNSDLAKTNSDFIENAKFSAHVMSAIQENAAGGGAHAVQQATG